MGRREKGMEIISKSGTEQEKETERVKNGSFD